MAVATEETKKKVLEEVAKYKELQVMACDDMVNSINTNSLSEEEVLTLISYLETTNKNLLSIKEAK